jgi:hypothetical protein
LPIKTGKAAVDLALSEQSKQIAALQSDIARGNLLTGIALTATALPIAHKLGRRLKGYLIVAATVATTYADENAGKPDLAQFAYLKATDATTVSIWFF